MVALTFVVTVVLRAIVVSAHADLDCLLWRGLRTLEDDADEGRDEREEREDAAPCEVGAGAASAHA